MSALSERLEACIAVEDEIGRLYNDFGNRFPEARGFFRELSKEEENHSAVLQVAKGYLRAGKLPEHVIPHSLPVIMDTLEVVRKAREKLRTDDVSLAEALETALSIESSVEGYLQETLTDEKATGVVLKLRKLLIEETPHRDRIIEFMENHGLKDIALAARK